MAGPQLEAGFTRIANELLEAAYRFKFSASQLSIILMIWRFTYGFSRKEHEMSVSFIAQHTGLHTSQIKKELSFLIDAQVILVIKESTRTSSRVIGINKKYEQWVVQERGVMTVEHGDLFGGGSGFDTTLGGSNPDTTGGSEIDTTGGSEIAPYIKKDLKESIKEIIYKRFEQFWSYYPKKVGKKDALRHFTRLHKEKGFSFDDFVTGTKNYVAYCQKINRILKDGSSFVNQETYKEFLDMSVHGTGAEIGPAPMAPSNTKAARNKSLLQQKLEEAQRIGSDADHSASRRGFDGLPVNAGTDERTD
ncbi:replication protein [Paenibacillus methanolicus]|uniref:replication protein n=1 Tax=Paenibacillus methanolicus TaxID=582686 RepID=UPI0011E7E0A4|nr:replication protein [Paenibacillus methanolicus]